MSPHPRSAAVAEMLIAKGKMGLEFSLYVFRQRIQNECMLTALLTEFREELLSLTANMLLPSCNF